MKHAVVLGAGMVGSLMAVDMADRHRGGFRVTSLDARRESLDAVQDRAKRHGCEVATRQADLSSAAELKNAVTDADIVLGALSSRIAFSALRTIIEAGKPFCDISFMGEDATDLDGLAKRHGSCCVVDCGVAPGMSHMLAAYGAHQLDACDSVEIYVGGLPVERRWPFQYKAAFSPSDVIEEYTRPTRLVEHGREVVRPALSEPELMDFEGVGTLEAFNTDGLRSLVKTLAAKCPNMKEKTLRYPGHIELMRVLREIGLFGEQPVKLSTGEVIPRELIAKLMFPQWTYQPGEADLTVMRVLARGRRSGKPTTLRWDVLDRYDPATGATSMARTTAFPCAIVARLIADGRFREPGVHPPEHVALVPDLLNTILAEHTARGIHYIASHE
ncbi:MAG: saccharopine dehydrogenase family protein [Phycisphaerales bacterium]